MAVAQTSELRMFIPLTKVDIEKRLVYGIATAEEPDLSGEICDYASTKPHYQKWSADVHKNSGGKSFGNLRSMHGHVAAGKVVDISFDDDKRKIEICAKVVDDNEWKKVQEGVYTGFSQGGAYVERWDDDVTGMKHYTANPSEISLVDLPCLPTATFSVVKGADQIEKRAFATVIDEPDPDAIKAAAEALAAKDGKGKTWRDFADDAASALSKTAMAEALVKLTPEVEPEKVEPEPVKSDSAAKAVWVEPKHKWDCGCADHAHVEKREAVACMKKRAAEAAATPEPELEALAKLEAAFGIEKAKPAKITAADVAAAHQDAAKAHLGAAELHEAMAAKDDTSSDDAENHLDAANTHRRAAKTHSRAAAMHESKDASADDASKKSGAMTDAAAAKSDALFMDKALGAETLTKYNEDEARDSEGRWTGSGAAADHAKSKAESVVHALGASAFAMGVGEVGSRVGARIGEKVGHYAGKAIALASTRSAAAGEGGAAVGAKAGRTIGSVVGRMYAESRAWAHVAGHAGHMALHAATGAEKLRKADDPTPTEADDPSQWDAGKEHQDAASAHRRAASAHMEMAAHGETPAADSEKHLLAAKANLLAAQKHDAAVGGKAEDSKAAQGCTDHACDCSMDALGIKKRAEGDLAKADVSDEPRDDKGEWTVGGIAAHAARAAIGAGAGALTGGGPGAVAGGIGGATSSSALGAAGSGLAGGLLFGAAGKAIGAGLKTAANASMRAMAGRTAAEDSVAAAKDILARGPGGSHPAVYAAAQQAMRGTKKVRKGLGTTSRLLCLIDELVWIQREMQSEAAWEEDGSPLPAALQTVIESLSAIGVSSAQEETSELFKPSDDEGDSAVMAQAAGMSEGQIDALTKISKADPKLTKLGKALEETQGGAIDRTIARFVAAVQTLVKTGARNSKADASQLQQAHDLLSNLGAKCDDGSDGQDEDDVGKLKVENAGLRKSMTDVEARLETVLVKVAEMGKRAAPAKAALRSVEKSEDTGGGATHAKATPEQAMIALKALPAAEQAAILMKLALANPVAVIS